MDVTEVEDVREGLVLNLRRSKTFQTGQGRNLVIPFRRTRHCPVAALTAWLDNLNYPGGKIFRPVHRHGNLRGDSLRADTVSTILPSRLIIAGINPNGVRGHKPHVHVALALMMNTELDLTGALNWDKDQIGTRRRDSIRRDVQRIARYGRDHPLMSGS